MRNEALHRKSIKHQFLVLDLVVVLCFLALGPVFTLARTPPPSNPLAESDAKDSPQAASAVLSLDLDREGPSDVTLAFDSRLASKYNFAKVLSNALGCPLQDLDYSPENKNESVQTPRKRTALQFPSAPSGSFLLRALCRSLC